MTSTYQTKYQQTWLDKAIANFDTYKSKYIVHNEQEIYFVSSSAIEASEWRKDNENSLGKLSCFLLSKHFLHRRFLSIRIKSLRNELWIPEKYVTFYGKNGRSVEIGVLVDSGADTTFIPYLLGLELGFSENEEDPIKVALGVGSSVKYVEKMLNIKIDSDDLKIPVCWCLDETIDDLLLGREGIFSKYKVIFDETQKLVVFEKNPTV